MPAQDELDEAFINKLHANQGAITLPITEITVPGNYGAKITVPVY